jgi:glutaredoxin
MKIMKKIEIYTNNTCGYCKQLKEELTKNNIEFEEKLISEFTTEWQDIINLTGLPTTPTIKYNNEYFVPSRDYQNPQQLINILETFNDSPYNETKRTFERIKTLNYNINMAFGRLDQLLRKIETKLNTEEDEH